MSDYKENVKALTYEELLQKNLELRQTITHLRNQIEENNKCTSRCQPPTQTYKELETKLQNFEIDKNREIDELWATKIKPLREKVEQCEKSLDLVQSMTINDGRHIRELQETIKDQQTIINYAAGYISACEQFRDKHPNYVKEWLFEGLKHD
jgi:cell division septum initiation protein DivIVA